MNLVWNGGGTLHLNAFLIQPFQYCRYNCKDCYLKYLKKNNRSVYKLHLELINEILRPTGVPKIKVKQLTISMNTLPTNKKVVVYNQMKEFWIELLKIFENTPVKDIPEIHLTFKDPNTYSEYTNLIYKTSHQKTVHKNVLDKVSLISFSNLEIRDKLLFERVKFIKDKINWNWMPNIVTYEEMDLYLKYVVETIKNFKSTYLIFKKNPLGDEQDGEYLLYLIRLYNKLKDNYPEVLNKITIDNCLQCAIARNKGSEFGCSSNISVMHMWPNGHITGCPYNSKKVVMTKVTSLEQILKEINARRNIYDFDFCQIPKLYSELYKNILT